MNELAFGLHRWATRHPEWHPGARAGGDGFGAEVGSYAVVAGDELLLVDPLVADDDDATLERLDTLSGAAVDTSILITIGYHVRSAEALAARYGATVHGPPQVAKRLREARFAVLEPGGAPGPAGVVAHAIGRPRRGETPLWLPSHRALAFGDALVATPDGELRMWSQERDEPSRRAFYRERFAPTLQPLVDLRPHHVLVTHGEPIVDTGEDALRAAAAADAWFHAG